ncbi:glycosyltransferase [Agarivorans sp. 1_MG-2023]|uniref:glycosyltransferase n=1 Tax=Agarivorans sp. 1_MG-2023 TaxID=3062634 RepID=UPI0026E442BF|nr:glycosyltransferase [Agarivorans sp. 1_MG-2023]MDO6765156.1 glycosyltransferase [Agarivorans sp. 1_MG-2023]
MSIWIQVVQHLQPGGIETMALDLQRMEETHEQGVIISLEGNKEEALAAWPRLRPFADRLMFLDKKPGFRLSTLWKLVNLFRRWAVPVVHTHHIGPLIYGGIAARLAGVKVVIHTEHDAWHLRQQRRRLVQAAALRFVKPMLVADANLVAGELKAALGFDDEKVQVIKNGVDTRNFAPGSKVVARRELGLPEHFRLIGCAGRLELEKGQAVLIESLSFLPEDVHLAFAGDGSQRKQLEQLVESLHLQERVHFLGSIESMPRFYQSLDLFCLPSYFEGLSLVILEAQSCEVPAVVTNVGASTEALCPRTGTLVEPGSAFAMAQALEKKLEKPATGNPRQFVKQSGDLRTTARNYAALRHRYL